MSDLENVQCRYCYDNNNNDFELIMPCNCSTPVHKECLIRWVFQRLNNINVSYLNSEVCNSTYNIEYLPIIIDEISNIDYNEFERFKSDFLCNLIIFLVLFFLILFFYLFY